MSVFVLDQRKRAVMPCCEKRARQLLERGRAVVDPRYRFTIRLKDRVGGDLDSGGRTTGIAVVADEDGNKPAKVLCLRLLNRDDGKAGLSRAFDTGSIPCISRRRRLHRLAPVSAISVKRVRFDMQLCENPEILGVAYQQGTLADHEIREYVFEKLRAEVPPGNKAGTHVGPVAVRGSGSLRMSKSTPSTANFSIARTAIATPGNPRFLPVL